MNLKKEGDPKVLYVVNACLPNARAHGIQIINTCNALSQAGADLTLVTPAFFGSKGTTLSYCGVEQNFVHTKIFSFDIPGFFLRFKLRSVFFFVFVNFYLLYKILVSKFKREKLVVYARGEVVFALFLISYFVPVYFETHQIRNHENIYRKLLKRVVGVVVITDRLKEKFVVEYGLTDLKILVARDSVDLEKFSGARVNKSLWQGYGIPEGRRIVLYAGSLGTEKGVFTLAEAATLLAADSQVVFLGGLESQIAVFKDRYGAVSNITIVGQVNHNLIPEHIKSADVVILPDLASDTYANLYTSPMKLFEYMASGVPIVAADVPSLREVLTPESAIFFESGNPASLSTKIDVALVQPDFSKNIGSKAQEIVSEFTWKKRGERIFKHFKSDENYR